MPKHSFQLHPAQQDVFMDQLLNTDSPQYNIGGYVVLKGNLNKENFQKVISASPGVFDAFKMRFDLEASDFLYKYDSDFDTASLTELDFSDRPDPEQDARDWMQGRFNIPFRLKEEVLPFEQFLIKITDREHWFFGKYHHLITDGYGFIVYVQYIARKYNSLLIGEELSINYPLYHDAAINANEYYHSSNYQQDGEYWRDKILVKPEKLLQKRYAAYSDKGKQGATYILNLNEDQRRLLDDIQLATKAGLQQLTIAALLIYFGKILGSTEFIFGTPIHKRGSRQLRNTMGMFSGILPFKGVYKEEQTLADFLKDITNSQRSDYRHQNYLIGDLSRDLKINSSEEYLCEVLVNYEPLDFEVSFGEEIAAGIVRLGNEAERNPLELCWRDYGKQQALQLQVQFRYAYFTEEEIALMAQRVLFIIEQFPAALDQNIGSINILPLQEHALLDGFNNNQVNYPKDKSIVDVFEDQAERNPDGTAVVCEGRQLSYKSLSEQSNQLAHYLKGKGVKEETLVPLLIERCSDMLIGILGILKAKGAYVPIDMDFPQERISYMLEDTGAHVVVSSSTGRQKLPANTTLEIIELDEDRDILRQLPSDRPANNLHAGHLAYVIYTSGSTGKPKGVQISHRNLMDYVYGLDEKAGIRSCRSFALVSTIATDLGNTVLYGSLLTGGTLHVISKETASNIGALHEYFEINAIDCLKIVPSHWKALSMDVRPLLPAKLLIFGGEALQTTMVEMIRTTGTACRIINHYGPTETTIGKLLYEVQPMVQYGATIPIGKPFSNTKTYVLNKDMSLCPVGVPGQLYIAGDGLSRGYLNNDVLTLQKFIPNPFDSDGRSLMYGTGDQVQYQLDGNITFLGRVDYQVKIRGYRIELGEIDSVLNSSRLVSQGVVLAKEDNNGNKRLVGYVVPAGEFDKQSVQDYVGSKLPDYMVPAIWVELERMPLTSNGKIDRKALPDPDLVNTANEYLAPRNETEQKLAVIWQELLGVDIVGINDNFFEIGGHSLSAMRIVSAIRRELNVQLNITDLFAYPSIAGISAYLAVQGKGTMLPAIVTERRPEHIPLSFSQERLWFIDQMEGSIQYHVPAVLKLKGSLNSEALEKAFREIVNRHEILRTIIREYEGQGYQEIMDAARWTLVYENESIYRTDKTALDRHIVELINAAFDLSSDYMLRVNLVKLDEEDHTLVFVMHHIASDGWSRSILVKEVVALYEAYTAGSEAKLPELAVQYADYAIWQRKYMPGEFLESKISYWKSKLEGVATLQLPADYSRPAVQSFRGAEQSFEIDQELTMRLMALSHQHGATLYMTLLAAFNVLLYRYSGEEDICVGTLLAGRNQQELEGLIGFFINTLALRSQVMGEMPFTGLLEAVKGTTLGAYAHQEVPFEKVVDAVVKTRDMSRSPLFQVMFSLQNTPDVPELKLGALQLSAATQEHTTAKFELSFMLGETSSGVHGVIEYSTDLYKAETIARMTGHYLRLLESIVAFPEEQTGRLAMLSGSEEQTLLTEFNDTQAEYPKDKSIVDLFEEQVKKSPTATAVLFEDKKLTYQELNKKSNQLARYLQQQGVKAETLVPVCVERSLEMLIGILGILKAGGAYVPIDPAYPAERISYMVADAGASIVLSSRASREKISGNKTVKVIAIDGDWQQIKKQESSNLQTEIHPTQLAYVIYTSGSTGKPKGVMIEHGSSYAFIAWCGDEFSSSQFTMAYATTSICFDLSVFELFYPLSSGKPVRILENGLTIPKYLNKDTAVLINTVPSVIENLQREKTDLSRVSVLNMAGEPIPAHVLEGLDTTTTAVRNLYGPTEDTTYSTICRLEQGKAVTIGRPIANTRVYILNRDQTLAPVGVAGELCLGGAGLARGYLNQPELTKEKFIKNPFSTETGSRLYRTGDLARWLTDGNIEYLGRIDDQVKIRGYRIELGEIESVLNQSESIQQAVVLAKADQQGNKRLVGYVVATTPFDKQAIQTYLSTRLPAYMVPAIWVTLESIPLTANGKIDKKALPDPELKDVAAAYVAPRNPTEQTLTEIWQHLLVVERVGIHDNFFELGGHSLLAMRVVSAIRKELNVELSIRDLFVYPNIAGLGAYLEEQAEGSSLPAITAGDRPEYIPLSFSQERLWFIDSLEGSVQYHLPAVIRLKGTLNQEALEKTLSGIISRHEILRTVVHEHEGLGYQQIMSPDRWSLGITELTVGEASLSAYIANLISKPFDLSADYMLRADLIRVSQDDHLLVATMHHIASDGWSISVLVKEVMALYEGYVAGNEAKLEDLPVQYADYAIWQRRYLQGELLEEKLNYWKSQLEGVATLQLPADYSRPAIQSSRGATSSFRIDQELTAKLVALSHEQRATLYMSLLAAFKVLLYRYSGQEDICVGTPIAGRNQQELEGLIGFFVNTLALRSQVKGEMSFIGLLEEVKETTLKAYSHQEVPFEKVVDAVVKERDMSRNPLFQVMLIFENTPEIPELKMGELSLSAESQEHTTSKVDISLFIIETGSGIQGTVEYATDLYRAETIERLISHYMRLLGSIVATPEEQVGSLNMLSEAEATTLQYTFNNTQTSYPKDQSLVDLLEAQAAKTPAATAVIFEDTKISYQTLNEKANQLARYLQKQGVQAETLVPVCIERSIEMIIGILGILKAGGAYVPVDPAYPQDRISYMLEDTAATLILTNKATKEKLSESAAKVIELDTDWAEIAKEANTNLQQTIQPTQLAYMIYTSGSTGKPKGAMNEHGGIVNRLLWTQDYFGLTSTDAVLQKTTFSFDVSVWELFWPLIAGAKLVFAKPGGQADSGYLKTIIEQEKITLLHFVPSMLGAFLPDITAGECKNIKHVLCSGEALNPSQVQQFTEKLPGAKLHNLYGPTEAAIDVSCWSYTPTGEETIKTVPIGSPVANTQLYILSKDNELSPMGVAGELYIGGVQVGRGYLNRPELTAEKFIKNQFNTNKNARLYRTGDLARWQPDGNIEYLGRIDDQVKIRGYRIELGEIESVLNEHEGITQGVVLVKEDRQGTKRLIGYVVPNGTFDKQQIQNYLNEKLPEYMVPGIWVELSSIPLTQSGKADRKALPDPELSDTAATYAAPRNETEEQLAATWQDLLGLEQVGIYDNFFELGGDSILTIQVVSRMRRLGHTIQPKDLFNHQTIAALSAKISRGEAAATRGEQGILTGTFGLVPVQAWYLEKEQVQVSHFNQSVLLKINKDISPAILQTALCHITNRHDALRLSFAKNDNQWEQTYGETKPQLKPDDLTKESEATLAAAITTRADYYQRSLDIHTGKLLQAALLQTPQAEQANRLFIVIHHLGIDGVSWRILLEDLEQSLGQLMNNQQPAAAVKSSSYRQWQAALTDYSTSNKLQEQESYWAQTVSSYKLLPEDKSYSGAVLSKDMGDYQVKLGAEQTRRLLQEVPKVYHTEINDMLLGALSSTLCSWSGRDEVVIGLEGHGREAITQAIDSSATIGWFTSLYPVLLPAGTDQDTLIKGTKEALRSVPDKGLGYGVLKYINKAAGLQGKDPWDIIFNYLGQLDTAVGSGNWLAAAGESQGSGTSEDQLSASKLSVNSQIFGGELILRWKYSTKHYNAKTITKVAETYLSRLQELIAHCQEQAESIYTPSDYGLSAEITYSELDRFLAEPHNGKPIKEQIESIYRLSGLQQGILFHGLYDNSGSYIEQVGCDLLNADKKTLIASWSSVIQNHSILRSAFYYDTFNVPVQVVFKTVTLPVTTLDYSNLDEQAQQAALKAYEATDRTKGFDFKAAPLMRLTLIKLTKDRYRMVWTSHHLLFDGWSLPILIEEFLNTYEQLLTNQQAPQRPEDRYEDYIRYLESRDKASEEEYWRHYLRGISQGTLLPFIGTTAERTKGKGEYGSLSIRLDGAAAARIQGYAQSQRLTVNTLMQGVWALLLHQYTGNREVLYGVVVSGRPDELPGVEHRVGMYINTLAFKSVFDAGQDTTSWLQGLQADQVSSRQYQYTALQEVQGWTGIKGDLFDSLLIFENYPVSKLISSKSWSLQVEKVEVIEQTNYPLTLSVLSSEEIVIRFDYNAQLLEEAYVSQIRAQFEQVLLQITEGTANTLDNISILTPSQEEQLRYGFNDTASAYPKDKTLIDLFEQQVKASPDATAILFEDQKLSYKELNEKSNQLARYLQKQGVKAETLVPICIERSLEMIVGMLGILKSGGAYVPVDADYPADRISYMLEDSGASLVLSSSRSRDKVSETVKVIAIDENWPLISKEKSSDLQTIILPGQLAYVMYTSGSTGRPKGVMIEHSSVLNYCLMFKNYFELSAEDKILQQSTISFDTMVEELYPALISGASVIVVKEGGKDIEAIRHYIENEKATILSTTPTVIEWLNRELIVTDTLRYIISGGEVLPPHFIDKLYDKVPIANGYGPTEATVCATYHKIDSIENASLVGQPVSNAQVYILTNNNELSPVGVPGEICVGGAGLARGYLNQPELTAEKFIKDPFSEDPKARLYKTGDLGRWLPDGKIEYEGRIDEQVKIRGYRIELGEIESILNQSDQISQGVVLAKQDSKGNKRLVGYVVAHEKFDKQAIQRYLSSKLPEYMVPGLWVELTSIPLTPSGKIDRKALPHPELTDTLTEYVAPRNTTEAKLAIIWQELLGLEQIGIQDNFFELGGNSLLVMRAVSAIRKELSISIPIDMLFQFTCISDLSKYLEIQNNGNLQEKETDEFDVVDI